VSTLSIYADDDVLSTQPRPASSPMLNFLNALTMNEITIFSNASIGLLRTTYQIAGSGAFSTVEVGTKDHKGRVLAVKQNRLMAQPLAQDTANTFDRYFVQLALELRILGHRHLAQHPNIVNLLGLGLDEHSEEPIVSLILEYSPYGDLRTFFNSPNYLTTVLDQIDFAVQVARGLKALHQVKICHGDLKLENVLVFLENEQWVLKLSDFGLSVIAYHGDPSGRVGFPSGTPLYSAPEVRKGTKSDDESFTIHDALLTDVFSFGLLIWEVLKGGNRYTKDIEPPNYIGGLKKCDITADHLNELAPDSLLAFALDSADQMALDSKIRQRVEAALSGSLRDSPEQRTSISVLSRMLAMEDPSI
jgi:serine/threonine protein kinase